MPKTQEEYHAMTERELWEAMQHGDKHELRKIHKALRKYGDGVPFIYRYPDFPAYLYAGSIVLSVAALVVKLLS